MSAALEVWFGDALAGLLTAQGSRLRFRYEPAWLKARGFTPLSPALPRSARAYSGAAVETYFENLLPEGRPRDVIAHVRGVSKRDIFGLLAVLGGDCAGAVSLWPPGARPRRKSYAPLPRPALEILVTEVIHAEDHSALLIAHPEARATLAGSEQKMPATVAAGRLRVGRAGAPTTHVVKAGSKRRALSPVNEVYCMALARALGLQAAESALIRTADPVAAVRRHDRRLHGSAVRRLHALDLCQALKLPSARKYEDSGGPSLRDIFRCVRRLSAAPRRDVRALVRWTLFNYLIGNGDTHAKNLSLLAQGSELRLAPFYDLLCLAVYPGRKDRLALAIGGETRPERIGIAEWKRFAADAGIGISQLGEQVMDLVQLLPAAMDSTARGMKLRGLEQELIHGVMTVISGRSARLHRLFGPQVAHTPGGDDILHRARARRARPFRGAGKRPSGAPRNTGTSGSRRRAVSGKA